MKKIDINSMETIVGGVWCEGSGEVDFWGGFAAGVGFVLLFTPAAALGATVLVHSGGLCCQTISAWENSIQNKLFKSLIMNNKLILNYDQMVAIQGVGWLDFANGFCIGASVGAGAAALASAAGLITVTITATGGLALAALAIGCGAVAIYDHYE